MAEKLKFKAIRLNQPNKKDQDIFITSIKVRDLLDTTHFKINWWEREKIGQKKQGYQRKPTPNRKIKIARYLEKVENPIFPSNLLINSDKKLNFIPDDKANFGILELPGHILWIVDGQTRMEGFKYAVEKLKLESVLDYEMPVTILSNFTLIDELQQFFILNSTQKKVSTDLAQRLKLQLAYDNPKQYKNLDIGEDWELKALVVTDLLNDKNVSPWYEKIRLPNTQKSPVNIISQNSFVRSLKPLYHKGGILDQFKPDDAFEILKNYWLAIERLFPDTFRKPKDYVIQKTPGIFSLHTLAEKLLNNVFYSKKEFSEDNIYKLLSKVFSGKDILDNDFDNHYWQKDNYEGAARAGSMKGFAKLAEEFKENLPELEI